jgi:hypothetical protein
MEDLTTLVEPKKLKSVFSEKRGSIVIAVISFTDALTGLSFKAGDTVTGWSAERVDEYSKRGLVCRVSQIGPMEVK